MINCKHCIQKNLPKKGDGHDVASQNEKTKQQSKAYFVRSGSVIIRIWIGLGFAPGLFLCEKIFVYRNLTPPSITNHIKDVCVQESYSTTSGTEKYVIKKLDTEKEVEEYFKAIQEVIDMLNESEKLCFKAEYLSEITLEKLLEKTTSFL